VTAGVVISGLVKAQLGFHMSANDATIAAVILLVTATGARRRQLITAPR
jgi:hypothetical protein